MLSHICIVNIKGRGGSCKVKGTCLDSRSWIPMSMSSELSSSSMTCSRLALGGHALSQGREDILGAHFTLEVHLRSHIL